MSDPDREAKTPRLTATWSLHEEHAHQVSERCRAYARVATDTAREKRLRDLSDKCEDFARGFRRWSMEDVPTLTKIAERQAWSELSKEIDRELESG